MNPDLIRASLLRVLSSTTPEVLGAERHYRVRAAHGEYPVHVNLSATASVPRAAGDVDTRAAGDPPVMGDRVVVNGVASSTSVDWYGTEMSPDCLQGMAQQFTAGVGVYPNHGGGLFGPALEWDQEMGRTSAAELTRANVAEPADATEPGWVLNVSMDLDATDPKVQSLVRRLGKQPIGLSIGGWFTDVRYVTDEDGELLRVIVNAVELDHLAVVRTPANPDCMGLDLLRSAATGLRRTPVPDDTDTPATPATLSDTDPIPAAPADADPASDTDPVAAADTDPAGGEDGNPAGVTDSPVLDSVPAPGEDRGVPEPAPGPTHEDAMTPDELRALLDAALSPINTRLAAIEGRSTPATTPAAEPESVEARVAKLEGVVARQRTVISNLSSQPQRMSGGHRATLAASGQPAYAATEIGRLLKRCEEDGESAMAVREVVTRHQPMLSVKLRSRGADGAKLREACDQAEDILRELCCAADEDGTLREWRTTHAA